MHQGYDLIGDIHGCGLTLIDLLEQMGYSKRNGVYQHPKRKVVFWVTSLTVARTFVSPAISFVTWWKVDTRTS